MTIHTCTYAYSVGDSVMAALCVGALDRILCVCRWWPHCCRARQTSLHMIWCGGGGGRRGIEERTTQCGVVREGRGGRWGDCVLSVVLSVVLAQTGVTALMEAAGGGHGKVCRHVQE